MIEPRTPPSIEDIAAHYDEVDELYRALWGEHAHHGLWSTGRESVEEATRNVVAHAAERLGIRRGERICDVGCGYGATARLLARELGASVTGLTLSPAQHAYALRAGGWPGDPEILLLDFSHNGFSAASFDVALAIEATEHFADKPALFGELQRIVRPGGRLGIWTWLACERPAGWRTRWILEPLCRENRLPSLCTETEYRAWLQDAGFVDIEVEDHSDSVRRTWTTIGMRGFRRSLRNPLATIRGEGSPLALFRIWLGYRVQCLRYAFFLARRGEHAQIDSDRIR